MKNKQAEYEKLDAEIFELFKLPHRDSPYNEDEIEEKMDDLPLWYTDVQKENVGEILACFKKCFR